MSGGEKAGHTEIRERRRFGIAIRTALLSWLVTIATVLLFVAFIIPEQKLTLRKGLESKARLLAVSLENVNAGAAVVEDYTSVVDHGLKLVAGDPALDYLVLSKQGGLSIVIEKDQWRMEPVTPPEWLPEERHPYSILGEAPIFNRRVFQYTMPFDYSGIEWGWIHVGLSLDEYDRRVAAVFDRTLLIALFCIILGLVASALYARHLVKPILNLREAVQHVTGGDLNVRVEVKRRDELGHLAGSVNEMTGALQRRDQLLESLRFAAQRFLSAGRWEDVMHEVLAKVGDAAALDRIDVLQRRTMGEHEAVLLRIGCWVAGEAGPDALDDEQPIGFDGFIPLLNHGGTIHVDKFEMESSPREWLQAMEVRSTIVMPITLEHSVWGVLCLSSVATEHKWPENESASFETFTDILGAAIARRAIQDDLIEAKDHAEAANRAKSQFLANMSHEIRTPITGVLGMLRLLRNTSLDERQKRFAGNAVSSAETLLAVIGDVLDFSKIEAGQMELAEHAFAPTEVASTVMRLFTEQAKEKGLEIAFEVAEGVPGRLVGDSDRLRQVLVNLISNAIKFTEQGSVIVTCEVESTTAASIILRFEVRDTGVGVPAETQRIIFDPFFQADSSMTRRVGGSGLGLNISRTLCELMGGNIGVESRPGEGSTFWFTIRCQQAEAVTDQPGHISANLNELKILVVDDNADARRVCCQMLGFWNARVREAPDARTGLRLLREEAARGRGFDVAVIDWKMKEMDGVEMARQIKADESIAETPLVLMSGFVRLEKPVIGVHDGFAAALSKPASPSELYNAVMTAVSPRISATDSGAEASGRSNLPTVPAGTVLFAEDNEINREVGTEILAELGCRYFCAVDGKEALDRWRQGGVDLILMDCQMPLLDGYEVTGAIRRDENKTPGNGRIPIIALTAHATPEDRTRCLAAGMDDYLSKPFEPQLLADALNRWMPRRASAPEPSGPVDLPSLVERCMGKHDLVQRMVKKLISQADRDLVEIRSGVEAADPERLIVVTHRLKGAAANVSALALCELAGGLEHNARAGEIDRIAAQLKTLEHEIERLKEVDCAHEQEN